MDKNSVVDFAEGILGIGHARNEVAKCLKQEANNQDVFTAKRMNMVAGSLECGLRIDIELIRSIGEKPLAETQRLFLNAEKENSI